MAVKIVQVVNLINRSIAYTTTISAEQAYITPANYSGTLTWYCEGVSGGTGSGNTDWLLRNSADSTTYATISFTAANQRIRASIASPPSSATEFSIKGSSGDRNIVAARILIIQSSSTTITATETQIEIGSYHAAKTNTAAAALDYPKYWYYDASKWDGSLTFSAEVVWQNSSTKGTVTVILQRDSGTPFTFDTTVATIVNAAYSTAATRTRVTFTAVDAKNYRLVAYCSSTKYNYTIYCGKIVVAQTATPITKLETVQTVLNTNMSATGLTDRDVAHYSDTTEWDGCTVTRYHEVDITSSFSTNTAKLQSDPNGTPVDITNSSVTATAVRTRGGSALTMPSGTPATIDTNIVAYYGVFTHSKIICQIAISAATNLTVANGSQSQAAGNVALTQKHNITVANGAQGHAATSPVLVQVITLVIQDCSQGHAATVPTLIQKIPLVVANTAQAHAAGNVVLTQQHVLTAQDAAQAQTAPNVALTQQHNLSTDDVSQSHAAENVDLTQKHILSLADASQAHAAEAPALTQQHALALADASQAQSADAPTLIQIVPLTVAGAAQAHAADNVVVEEVIPSSDLTVQSVSQGQAAGNVVLTQKHTLTIQGSTQVHVAETPALGQKHNLTAQGADQVQVAENVTLSQTQNLNVANGDHTHAAESMVLTQAHSLSVADGYQGHAAISPTLTTRYNLAVQDALQAHTVQSPLLAQLHQLSVADGYHDNLAEEPVLITVGGGGEFIPIWRRRRVRSGLSGA